jgi:hypothetical protein
MFREYMELLLSSCVDLRQEVATDWKKSFRRIREGEIGRIFDEVQNLVEPPRHWLYGDRLVPNYRNTPDRPSLELGTPPFLTVSVCFASCHDRVMKLRSSTN